MYNIILTSIFLVFFSKAYAFKNDKTYHINKLIDEVSSSQIKQSEDPHKIGLWPISVQARNINIAPISEDDLFLPLQTILSLHRSHKFIELPQLSQMDSLLKIASDSYLLDTLSSNRKQGSVCFWPYRMSPTSEMVHNFANDKNTFDLFAKADLLNDLDTSSRLALWLGQVDPSHEFIEKFIETAIENTSKENGAYMTWVHNDAHDVRNNTDCVVNMNVLATMSELSGIKEMPKKAQIANKHACRLINKSIENNDLSNCSRYYDRFLEASLSYALALDRGVGCLKPSLDTIKKTLFKKAEKAINEPITTITHSAELILSLYYVGKNLPKPSKLTLYAKALQLKLINVLSHKAVGKTSVFIGKFPKDIFDWQSFAYSKSLVIEALALF